MPTRRRTTRASRSLWGLNNTGQTVDGVAGLADADIDGPRPGTSGTGLGSSVRVAVIDSGVARTHPDLAANMFTNPGESGGGKQTNGIDDDGNGMIDDFRGWDFVNNDNNPADDNGHGTHVAGTIAARSNNGLGVAGAASFPTTAGNWLGPKILAVKVLDEEGSGTLAGLADGIVYAGTMNAKVANASLSAAGTSATLDNAIKSKPGTLYVVAAGNNGANNDTAPRTPCNPATTPDAANKICVAATDSSDALAGFSNFGAVNVDLAAPGVDILSTVPTTKTFFTDDFETPIAGRWTTNDAGQTGAPRWARTTLFSTSPTNSITDSPAGNYVGQPEQLGAQHHRLQPHRGQQLQGHGPGEDRHRGRLRQFHRSSSAARPRSPRSWQPTFLFNGAGQGTVTADRSRRLQRADRRLRPVPPRQRRHDPT